MNIEGSQWMPKHSVQHGNWKTSVSCEWLFWNLFKKIVGRGRLGQVAFALHSNLAEDENLSSAIRVYVLKHEMARARDNERRAKTSKVQVQKTRAYSSELRLAIRALTGADEATRDGFAPMSVVIAAGRPNG